LAGGWIRNGAEEYGRARREVANEELKSNIKRIDINKCARESGFNRKKFVRTLVRGSPVKRNTYNDFVRWLQRYKLLSNSVNLEMWLGIRQGAESHILC
jgi:hypothetical protein